ncbi:hypothetical protein JZ751_021488 [Albula glossodonta]|uniref:Uncharacterized protein n=1 Tax=Albula glossodonta TaxID=121402 RepID=A0A8T2NJ03_9TELE|nr:hypothetical protein JZ751_021488 [Albula glossodonta]
MFRFRLIHQQHLILRMGHIGTAHLRDGGRSKPICSSFMDCCRSFCSLPLPVDSSSLTNGQLFRFCLTCLAKRLPLTQRTSITALHSPPTPPVPAGHCTKPANIKALPFNLSSSQELNSPSVPPGPQA